MRVGVTTGEALVSLGVRPLEGEGMAAGDVVNTAARLQTSAPVDGILVDETTFRATERAIEYRSADPVQAKGKIAPIAVWEALEARSHYGIDITRRVDTALVGREQELTLLRDALDRARHQAEPQLVTLVGEPGIGKSRLVHELFVHIEGMPDLITWRQGRCLPYGDGVSYWALGEMVKAEAGILETDTDGEAAAKVDRTVTELIAEEDEQRWVARHLRPLIGLTHERDAGSEAMEDGPAAWRRFLEALAERRPTVLVFEDLHWADDGLLDFLDDLIDWTRDVPLLVVCTARPELLARRPGWGGGKLNATTLALAPLSEEETAVLLAGLLDRSVLPAELQSALLVRAGGNPCTRRSSHGWPRIDPSPTSRRRSSRARCRASSPRGSTASTRRTSPCCRTPRWWARPSGSERSPRSARASEPTSSDGSTSSNAVDSFAGRAVPRSAARPNTRSCISSCGTWPTDRSRGGPGDRSTARPRPGSGRSAATDWRTERSSSPTTTGPRSS